MNRFIVRLLRNEEGQDTIEYALLGAFIAVASVAVIKLIGPLITPLYTSIKDALTP